MLTHHSRSSLAKIVILSVSVICLYNLLLPINQLPTTALAAPVELFFSEYVEGSSYNKALEIYNGTGSDVDLTLYTIELYSNSSDTPSRSLNLSGKLQSGDVFVLVHTRAITELRNLADVVNGAVTNFDGNDTIILRKNDSVIDAIGQIGNKDEQWGEDITLRRKLTVESGDTNGDDPFDLIEWDVYSKDTFDGLGFHTPTAPTPIPTVTPTETATLTPTVTATSSTTATPTPSPTVTLTSTVIATLTPTETATPVSSSTITPTLKPPSTATPVPASPGAVVINEIVTDPQQDWSSDNFSGVAGEGSITDLDEFIELYIEEDGLDLSGWTIELTDSQTAIGDLTSGGAFKVSNYISNNGGLFTFTAAGDYLVLGDVKKADDAMNITVAN